MKKKRIILPILGVIIVLVAIVAVNLTTAFLMDIETADNIVTVGNVKLQVSEGNFKNSAVIAEGQKLSKAPQITNTGSKDEYVFFKVAVPKGNVTLLYESKVTIGNTEHKEGTPVGERSSSELFKMLATGSVQSPISEVSKDDYTKKIVFQYHSGVSDGNNNRAGWILLDTKTTENYNFYIFGYNKKLLAGDDATVNTTVSLFDEIQLKSFIDEELTDANVKVDVTAYGIQADELGISELGEYLNKTKLDEIWAILERKQVSVADGT